MNIFRSFGKNIISILIIFHLLFIMFLICLIRTIFTNAGNINEEYIEMYSIISFVKLLFEYLLNNYPHNYTTQSNCVYQNIQWLSNIKQNIENVISNDDNSLYIEEKLISFEEYFISHRRDNEYYNNNILEINHDNNRFCGFCLFKKPDRTHHCRYCHCCRQKLDHHCHLLATCIGENNYRYFFQTLFYLSMLLIYMICTSIRNVFFYIKEGNFEIVFFVYLFYFILICGVTVIECWFFLFHLKSLINNFSTIEYKEKIYHQRVNIYDNGIVNNICDVMGRNVIEWLIPLKLGKKRIKEYQYKINKINYEWYVQIKKAEKQKRKSKANEINIVPVNNNIT